MANAHFVKLAHVQEHSVGYHVLLVHIMSLAWLRSIDKLGRIVLV